MGALLGGVLGAALGYAAGGDNRGRAAAFGAALGGGAGALAGREWGKKVAAEKEQYANEEAWLDSRIAEARQTNAELMAYNNKLRNEIAKLKQLIAEAQNAADDRRVAIIAEQQRIENEAKAIQTAIDARIAKGKAEVKEAKRGPGRDLLANALNSISTEKQDLDNNVQMIASLGDQLDG